MLSVSDMFNIVPFFLMEITLSLNLGKYPGSQINYLNIEMETKSSFICVLSRLGFPLTTPDFCNVRTYPKHFLFLFCQAIVEGSGVGTPNTKHHKGLLCHWANSSKPMHCQCYLCFSLLLDLLKTMLVHQLEAPTNRNKAVYLFLFFLIFLSLQIY